MANRKDVSSRDKSQDQPTKRDAESGPVEADDETNDETEQSTTIPRWLKITAVAVPLVATVCAGIWTLCSVLMSQYVGLQTTLEKERTQQAAARDVEAEKNRRAAELHVEAEKEVTTRFQLQQTAQAATRNDEIRLQRLKTEEQQARKAILENELARHLAELRSRQEADQTAMQIQEDREFASLIAVILSSTPKPDLPSDAALAALLRYTKNGRYYDVMVAALAAKVRRINTLEEAQLCLRLLQAIQPTDFTLLTNLNRVARQRVEEQVVHEFWKRYAPHVEKMSPRMYLGEQVNIDERYEAAAQRIIAISIKNFRIRRN